MSNELWNLKFDAVMKLNHSDLKMVFAHLTGQMQSHFSHKKCLTKERFTEMLIDAHVHASKNSVGNVHP
jgi:hypothetical protein